MSDMMLALVMTEAKMHIRPEDSLEDRFRAAFKAAANHWMVLDPDVQFKGAVGAVWAASEDSDEKERIEAELRSLNTLAALLSKRGLSITAFCSSRLPARALSTPRISPPGR